MRAMDRLPALNVPVGRSRMAWLAIGVAHASAALIGLCLESAVLAALIAGLTLASWLRLARSARPGLAEGWVLSASPDGSWRLRDPAGRDAHAELLPGGLVQPWLIVLNFARADGRCIPLLLLRDNVDPELLRRLALRLRLVNPEPAGRSRRRGETQDQQARGR